MCPVSFYCLDILLLCEGQQGGEAEIFGRELSKVTLDCSGGK
jgi:hypothetical protein